MRNRCLVIRSGFVPFRDALEIQNNLFEKRLKNSIHDVLLLMEHPNTYSMGRRTKNSHIFSDKEYTEKKGIEVVEADRGGSVTYHGPGQLVGYPILDLKPAPDISAYIRNLEEVIILTSKSCGVDCERNPSFPGVWVDGAKLASIGIKVTLGVTKHGFGLNVNTDLRYFEKIIPCGIEGVRMTSLSKEIGRYISVETVEEKLADFFAQVFEMKVEKPVKMIGEL